VAAEVRTCGGRWRSWRSWCRRPVFARKADPAAAVTVRFVDAVPTRVWGGSDLPGTAGASRAHRAARLLGARVGRRCGRAPKDELVTRWLAQVFEPDYANVLISEEKPGQPADLLRDREADTFATWLDEHPGTEVICLDAGLRVRGSPCGG
jgi:hypothetical protein